MNDRLLVLGAGYSARAFLPRARERFAHVAGTTRSAGKAETLRTAGIEPLLFAGERSDVLARAIAETTHLLVCIGPDEAGDPALRVLEDELVGAPLRGIVYLSTIGVYGDHGGAWIDEDAALAPTSERSRWRVEAETGWRRLAGSMGTPLAILRLSGIYGPGRSPLEKLRRGTAKRIVKPGQVFNRIHAADIARAIERALEIEADGIFNVTDDLPAPPQDVVRHAASLLDLDPPPETAFEEAEMSPMARSFYGDNKRASNIRAARVLGWRPLFPTYREGLLAVLRKEREE